VRDLAEWRALFRIIGPPGEIRADMRMARLARVMMLTAAANASDVPKEEQFMLKFETSAEAHEMTPEETEASMRALFLAMGGTFPEG
jgi:hypothetical protein